MAKSKDDITHGVAQAKLSEDESLRVAYVGGDALEGGKIADSCTVDLFSAAENIAAQQQKEGKIAESEPVDHLSASRNSEKQKREGSGGPSE